MSRYADSAVDGFRRADLIAVSWRVAVGLLVIYAVLTIIAYFYARSAIFQPGYASRSAPEGLLRIPQPDGGSLAAIYLPNPAAKHTLWLFHGNAEALGDLEPFLQTVRQHGYAVFAFDYPGYGVSSGSPSETSVYRATALAARYLHDTLGVSPGRVVVYGRSLGGGPAVELAISEPVAGLVLQSAFTSVYRIMTQRRMLPFDLFENLRKLPRVACPVLIMHGRLDGVVPFAHGPALLAAVPGRKSALWIDEAGHNNFVPAAGPRFWDELKKFTDSL